MINFDFEKRLSTQPVKASVRGGLSTNKKSTVPLFILKIENSEEMEKVSILTILGTALDDLEGYRP